MSSRQHICLSRGREYTAARHQWVNSISFCLPLSVIAVQMTLSLVVEVAVINEASPI